MMLKKPGLTNYRVVDPVWLYTLVCIPIAVYFRFIGGTWLIHANSYFESVLNLGLISLLFGVWVIYKWRNRGSFLLSGLETQLAVFIAVVGLSTIFSTNRSISLEINTGLITVIAASFLLLEIQNYSPLWDGMIRAILITGGINVIAILNNIIKWFDLYKIGIKDIPGRLGYVLNALPRMPALANHNPNVTAVYLIILLPFFIQALFSVKKFLAKFILVLLIFLIIVILFLTQSRGVYIGLAALAASYLVLFQRGLRNLYKQHKTALILIIIISLCLVVISGYYVFQKRGLLNDPSMEGRVKVWTTSILMIRDHPLFGTGLGTFPEQFLNYRDPSTYTKIVFHAHNEILQIVTQIGFVGFGALGWVLIAYYRKVAFRGRMITGQEKVYVCALASFAGMGLVDAYFSSANITLLVIICAVGLMPQGSIRKVTWSEGSIVFVITILALLGGLDWYANWRLQPYNEARVAAYRGDWDVAQTQIQIARQRDPANPYYGLTEAQITGQIACSDGTDLEIAIQGYEERLSRYGDWGLVQANLAGLYMEKGDYQAAERYSRAAIEKDPEQALYFCLLGEALQKQDNKAQAVQEYVRCIALEPGWIDTSFWKQDPVKNELTAEVIKLVLNSDSKPGTLQASRNAELYWYLGEKSKSIDIINVALNNNPDNQDLLLLYAGLLIDRGTNITGSQTIIDGVINDHPRNGQAWYLKGIVSLAEGEINQAITSFELSVLLNPLPQNLWYLGYSYLQAGDLGRGLDQMQIAANWMEDNPLFSQWASRRFPIPGEKLPCLPAFKTGRDYYYPAGEAIKVLATIDCCEAAIWYGRLNEFGWFDLNSIDYGLIKCIPNDEQDCPP
jgi:O-antigen ligase